MRPERQARQVRHARQDCVVEGAAPAPVPGAGEGRGRGGRVWVAQRAPDGFGAEVGGGGDEHVVGGTEPREVPVLFERQRHMARAGRLLLVLQANVYVPAATDET
ncbi:hypothetical protein [Streptomyces sp. ME109]|uniref:hypothetical protein n=1 Tax=Streptomyces sp. me109 TaxID=1827853 RepID=UPI0016519A36